MDYLLSHRRLTAMPAWLLLAWALYAATGTAHAADVIPPFNLVPEMTRPDNIQAAKPSVLRSLAGNRDGERGLVLFRQQVEKHWPALRDTDMAALSRYHVDATRGYRLPATPGQLPGRTIAVDPDDAALYLELRGPRLPASFDIVHRHLTFYARFRPTTGELDRMTVTIRLAVFE